MSRRSAPVLLALLAAVAAQDAQMLACQSDLVSMSDQFNTACCANPANCASGAPTQCDAGCAAVWNPFCAQQQRRHLAVSTPARASHSSSPPPIRAPARPADKPAPN
jgi:hypothetical protein